MLEKAITGDKRYWGWIAFVLMLIGTGAIAYLRQLDQGLTVTGLSRDVSWGFYIAQFTFLVGVAASAVMVVLPYYLHNFKAFSKLTILGEFLAVPSVIMCMLFIVVDMGQPFRVQNVMLYPSLNSPMFWDMMSLSGYLFLNVVIGYMVLSSEKKGIAPPKWIKPFIIISIPWAISIHTVTAFLYSGLAARPFWMTAVLAPRFLASAFAAGPALLILIIFLMRKLTRFDAGKEAIQKLAVIATYAMCINVFLVLMEVFTTFYSGMPEHMHHFEFLYVGLHGNNTLVPWMWLSSALAVVALVLLLTPKFRKKEVILGFACIAVFVSIWIDKGLGMIVAGFTPSQMGEVVDYWPTLNEFMVSIMVWGIGLLIMSLLYKIIFTVRGETKPALEAKEDKKELTVPSN